MRAGLLTFGVVSWGVVILAALFLPVPRPVSLSTKHNHVPLATASDPRKGTDLSKLKLHPRHEKVLIVALGSCDSCTLKKAEDFTFLKAIPKSRVIALVETHDEAEDEHARRSGKVKPIPAFVEENFANVVLVPEKTASLLNAVIRPRLYIIDKSSRLLAVQAVNQPAVEFLRENW